MATDPTEMYWLLSSMRKQRRRLQMVTPDRKEVTIAPRVKQYRTVSMSSSKPNTVFVVDDDGGLLEALGRLLRMNRYDTRLFSSAGAFENHHDFGTAVCALLDINLGDGSGIELRYRLKAAGSPLPVIYMTGNDSPAVREAAHQSGCLAYLTKPFSARSLIEPLARASAALRRPNH